ncbi:hypothetical protein K474DRAFT_184298 [Panus rudis PR-1116 ss-1]|nr:hypothetical protein K474DRAFT_184298 [Panus rudis PR-1116 ss-1]
MTSDLVFRRQLNIPTFPQEVCERVIDECGLLGYDEEDPVTVSFSPVHKSSELRESTLAACSLVCHSWRTRSQQHLFHDLCVDLNNPKTSERRVAIDFPAEGADPTWIFTALYGKVPNLTTLALSFHKANDSNISRFHPSFQTVLSHFRSIRQVHLYLPRDLGPILACVISPLSHLDDLFIHLPSRLQETALPLHLRSPRKITSPLRIVADGYLRQRKSGPKLTSCLQKTKIRFSSLRTLVVQSLRDMYIQMIQEAGRNLEELVIVRDDTTFSSSSEVSLQHLTGLRILHYAALLPSSPPVVHNLLVLLASIDPSARIERIYLRFIGSVIQRRKYPWHELDDILCLPAFQSLLAVHIRFYPEIVERSESNFFGMDRLPRCHARAIVKHDDLESWPYSDKAKTWTRSLYYGIR